LINLVGNAIKFTKKGSVKVVVSYCDQSLQFEIIDTGIGMNLRQQERLFQPFSQGDHTVNREFGGTGLGLAISQRLATMLGGKIVVKSEKNRGSTFTLTIATGNVSDLQFIKPMLCIEPKVETPVPAAIQLNCRILVVDDRRDIRLLSRRFLTEVGASVTEAEDGQVAIQKVMQSSAEGKTFDLILLDMQMPKLDGYETAKQLRSLGFTGPIIALTADAMQGDMSRCIASGCNGYLSKPIDKTAMLKLVSEYVAEVFRSHY
jgi:CheY-like chemotaxis protein